MNRLVILGGALWPALCAAMTFQEVSQIAYEQSLHKSALQGERDALAHEKASYIAAEPIVLEGSARRIRADEANGDGMEYGMMVGFTAKTPWSAEAHKARYDAAMRSVEGGEKLQKGILQSRLKHEYLLSELAREEAARYDEKSDSAKKAYAMAQKKHEAGRISQMELLRFETEQQMARKEAEEARMVLRNHQDVLREMTLLPGDITIEDLSFRFVERSESEQRLKASAALEHFALSREEVNREIEALRQATLETVGIGVGMTQEPTQNSVDFRLSLPVSMGEKNERKIAALMAKRSALDEQKTLSERKLRVYIEQSLQRLEGLQRLIGESGSNEKRHESLYRMAQKGFEGGVVGLFEYLETKNRFYGAQIETLRLKRDYVDAVANLEERMGGVWE